MNISLEEPRILISCTIYISAAYHIFCLKPKYVVSLSLFCLDVYIFTIFLPGCVFEDVHFCLYCDRRSKKCHHCRIHIMSCANFRKKKRKFLSYGRSIGSWIGPTHKTYTCHTVQNITDTHNIVTLLRCTSMGVWGSMIY
jgi:hypothetical protein